MHSILVPTEFLSAPGAAALGEAVAGGARGAKDCVCITLGTGVGGGVFTIALVSSVGFSHPYRTVSGINADSNGDGNITMQELYNGIRAGVSQIGASQVTQGYATREWVAFIK